MSKWFRINSLVKCPTSQQMKKLEGKQTRLLTGDKYFGVASTVPSSFKRMTLEAEGFDKSIKLVLIRFKTPLYLVPRGQCWRGNTIVPFLRIPSKEKKKKTGPTDGDIK